MSQSEVENDGTSRRRGVRGRLLPCLIVKRPRRLNAIESADRDALNEPDGAGAAQGDRHESGKRGLAGMSKLTYGAQDVAKYLLALTTPGSTDVSNKLAS